MEQNYCELCERFMNDRLHKMHPNTSKLVTLMFDKKLGAEFSSEDGENRLKEYIRFLEDGIHACDKCRDEYTKANLLLKAPGKKPAGYENFVKKYTNVVTESKTFDLQNRTLKEALKRLQGSLKACVECADLYQKEKDLFSAKNMSKYNEKQLGDLEKAVKHAIEKCKKCKEHEGKDTGFAIEVYDNYLQLISKQKNKLIKK